MKNHKKNTQKKQLQNNLKQTAVKNNFRQALQKNIQAHLMKTLGVASTLADRASSVIMGLFSSAGVWQKKIAHSIISENQVASEVRAIQRFFSTAEFDYHVYGAMLHSMIRTGKKSIVALDRTNWKFGEKNINLFVAAVLCNAFGKKQSFAVPIVWEMLQKAGTSNTQERKIIMQKVLDIVGRDNIEVVLEDREFIGEEWIAFLLDELVPFIIRIRNSMYVEYKGHRVKVSTLCKGLKKGEKRYWLVTLNGRDVQLAATISKDGELVVVIASPGVEGNLLSKYRLRWLIELFFKSIKSRGFNIEETHMTDPSKIKVLFAMLAYATALSVQAGVVRDYLDPILLKNHGRPTYSLFTYGFDFIRELIRGVIPRIIQRIKKAQFLLQNCFLLSQSGFEVYALSTE